MDIIRPQPPNQTQTKMLAQKPTSFSLNQLEADENEITNHFAPEHISRTGCWLNTSPTPKLKQTYYHCSETPTDLLHVQKKL